MSLTLGLAYPPLKSEYMSCNVKYTEVSNSELEFKRQNWHIYKDHLTLLNQSHIVTTHNVHLALISTASGAQRILFMEAIMLHVHMLLRPLFVHNFVWCRKWQNVEKVSAHGCNSSKIQTFITGDHCHYHTTYPR